MRYRLIFRLCYQPSLLKCTTTNTDYLLFQTITKRSREFIIHEIERRNIYTTFFKTIDYIKVKNVRSYSQK